MIEKSYKSVISCLVCSKQREIYSYRLKDGRGKYCSNKCNYAGRKGRRVSVRSEFKKGHPFGKRYLKGDHPSPKTEFKKGHKTSPELIAKLSITLNIKKSQGIPNYHQLHRWVKKQLGTPNICWFCQTLIAPKFQWANKSGEYKEDIEDWIRLCAKCHWAYDRLPEKRTQIRAFLDKLQ